LLSDVAENDELEEV
jgi:hypothetical protein